jgi:DNA-directed RNA polymerase specialized sigma24 family protein
VTASREERFEQLARRAAPKLLGYVARRVDPPADAADVVAEVLLVAWRRLEAVPPGRGRSRSLAVRRENGRAVQ